MRTAEGALAVGRTLPGRGAWLCAESEQCVDLAERRRAFPRALKAPVDEDEVRTLRTKVAERARIEGRGLRRDDGEV